MEGEEDWRAEHELLSGLDASLVILLAAIDQGYERPGVDVTVDPQLANLHGNVE